MALLLSPPTFKPYRVFSAGWGTQSTAVLVLQAQGKLARPYDEFAWANVGDDSEHPETIDYYRNHIVPFAADHGIKLTERQRIYKGKPITLKEFFWNVDNSMPLPLYFSEGGKGNRKCTVDFKIEVVNRYLRMEVQHSHVEMGIGFSRDEAYRILKKYPHWHDVNVTWDAKKRAWKFSKKRIGFWRHYECPLTDLQLNRAQCVKLVMDAGLPEPPPSLCWWCPFQGRARLLQKKQHRPEMFQEMVAMEARANERYGSMPHSAHKSKAVYFHPDRIPLDQMPNQLTLWDEYMDTDETCQVGICDV